MKNALIPCVMDKVAIPIWENRVSPVLDTANRLLIIELNGKTEQGREIYNLPVSHIFQRTRYIRELHVNTMLCGALSRPFHRMLVESGIRVYPWLTGEVQDVVNAYLDDNLADARFALPGFNHRRRRCGGRHNHFRNINIQNKGNANQEES